VLSERAQQLSAHKGRLSGRNDEQLRRAMSALEDDADDSSLSSIESEFAYLAAKAEVARRLDKMVEARLSSQEKEFYDELRLDILRQRTGPDNAQTLSKFARLVSMDSVELSEQAYRIARPAKVQDIIGQTDAMRALTACLCSPFPQHVLLYGPPGIGKTSAARLALDAARQAEYTPFRPGAPFVEADGTTLRYDPHEAVNPLLGSVHDPIYQGARKELAGSGVPEPKLGMVSEAHGGVLFIDEIGDMDPSLQAKLLKVLEDKRVRFDSSYFDPDDSSIPAYIRKLFSDGAPADFILVGATTKQPHELSPALRSRCAEVHFRQLDYEDLKHVAKGAAARMGMRVSAAAISVIAAAAVDGRECVRLIAAAHGRAVEHTAASATPVVGAREAREAVRLQIPPMGVQVGGDPRVGQIHMLGVAGRRGCVLRMEAVTVPGDGGLHFNSAAGSLAQDAAHNARIALQAAGLPTQGRDIHLNITGGGNVDGPSAGLAMALVMLSCLTGRALRQDIAVTGEISLRGDVLPVGGVAEKMAAARRVGAAGVLLPWQPGAAQADALPVTNLWEAADAAFVEGWPLSESWRA
jgi:ATP-dependent Lon protease